MFDGIDGAGKINIHYFLKYLHIQLLENGPHGYPSISDKDVNPTVGFNGFTDHFFIICLYAGISHYGQVFNPLAGKVL